MHGPRKRYFESTKRDAQLFILRRNNALQMGAHGSRLGPVQSTQGLLRSVAQQ